MDVTKLVIWIFLNTTVFLPNAGEQHHQAVVLVPSQHGLNGFLKAIWISHQP